MLGIDVWILVEVFDNVFGLDFWVGGEIDEFFG